MSERSARYAAVIFDLFGTLVPEFHVGTFHDRIRAAAERLDADPDAFLEGWEATAIDRQLGRLGSIEGTVREICRRLGMAPPDDATVDDALAPRWRLYQELFVPKPDAVRTLAELRERGLPLGLISMCSPDTPQLWRASPLAGGVDVEVFSCETGLRKPDPEIYLACSGALGVDPARCLYIGDGAYGELTGAAAVGMDPVLIRHPGEEDDGVVLRPEAQTWEGPRISRLTQVLDLV